MLGGSLFQRITCESLQLHFPHSSGVISIPYRSNHVNTCFPSAGNDSTLDSHLFFPGPLLFANCPSFGFPEVKSDRGFKYMQFTERMPLRKN